MNYRILPGLDRNKGKRTVGDDIIIRTVCKYFRVKESDLKSPTRKRRIVVPRQIAMYLMTEYTSSSMRRIAGYFNRDRTTAIESKKVVKNLIDTGDVVLNHVETLIKLIHR